MSFSWWCKDKKRKDLFDEFGINGQALGLGDSGSSKYLTPHCVTEIREMWCRHPYKEKIEDSARAAMSAIQAMAINNLRFLEKEHPECPCCTCKLKPLDGFDIEQAKRFVSIPLDRVWRAGGGW